MHFIPDGYTATKTVPARPGLHAAAEVSYRPALHRKRHEWARAHAGDPVKAAAWESQLLADHVVSFCGEPLKKEQADRLVPALRASLLDLVLGYEPAEEVADAGNSDGG